MKFSYIFDRKPMKEENSIRINTSFKPYLPNSYKIINEDLIYIFNSEEYKLSYTENVLYGEASSIFYVIFEYVGESQEEAYILENMKNSLNCQSINENFNRILVFDGVSEHYCNLAYPIINNFERTIRELIYIILAKAFGYEWADNLLETEQKYRVKKNLHNSTLESKKLENALYGMDFGMMINFLFVPYRSKIQKIMVSDDLQNFTKEQLLEYIKDTQLDSIWNLYFSEYKIENIEESLKRIQNYRNIIAHSKVFNYKDFIDFKETVKNIQLQIELAINIEVYKTFDLDDLKLAFQKIQNILEEIMNPEFEMENFLLKIDDVKRTIASSKLENITESMNNLSKVISNMSI